METRFMQTNPLWLASVVLTVIVGGITLVVVDGPVWVISAIAFAVLFVVVVVAGRLTVTVGTADVVAAFGWGWPRRQVASGDITAVRSVRNRWVYGWGIRVIPNGWLYNVWGLDAVELELRSGRRFRIGTDQPEQLAAAIEAMRQR